MTDLFQKLLLMTQDDHLRWVHCAVFDLCPAWTARVGNFVFVFHGHDSHDAWVSAYEETGTWTGEYVKGCNVDGIMNAILAQQARAQSARERRLEQALINLK